MRNSPAAKPAYYSALQLEPDASDDEIRSAYLRLIRENRERPRERDRARTERAREINLAYATLGNPRERRAYDSSFGLNTGVIAGAGTAGAHALGGTGRVDDDERVGVPESAEEAPAPAEPEYESSAIPLRPEGDGVAEQTALSAANDPDASVFEAGWGQASKASSADRENVEADAPTASSAPFLAIPAAALLHESNADARTDTATDAAVADPHADHSASLEVSPLAETGEGGSSFTAADPADATDNSQGEPFDAPEEHRRNRLPLVIGAAAISAAGALLLITPSEKQEQVTRGSQAAGASSSGYVESSQPVAAEEGMPIAAEEAEEQTDNPVELALQEILPDVLIDKEPAAEPQQPQQPSSELPPAPERASGTSPTQSEPEFRPVVASASQPDLPPPPVQRPSRASPATWIAGGLVDADNPGGRFAGRVDVRFTVTASGRVVGCTPVGSSGDAALDAMTCRMAEQRLRFTPATDSDGRPVSSEVRTSYTWGRRSRR